MKRQHDDVTQFINGALDASRNELISSPSRTAITIDELGLRARSFNWQTGQPTGLEAWLTGSQLAFSDDSFTTARLALGRINSPGSSGGTSYGLVGDVLVGRVLAGNNLHISNSGNNFLLDETGAWLENASFTLHRTIGGTRREIILDPQNGLTFRNGNQNVITMSIIDGSATFAGQITGGSININNRFRVDGEGNVTISSGSIDIGNGQFIVDTIGRVTMRHATITGGSFQIGGTTVNESFFRTTSGADCHFTRSILDQFSQFLGPLNGGQINDNSINANSIVANSITANQMAANSITANELAANSVMANNIQAGAITSEKIMAGTITTNHIAAAGISAERITTGTMSANRISGGTISGVNIDGMDASFNGVSAVGIFMGGWLVATQQWVLQQISQLQGVTSPGAANAGHTHTWSAQ
jgi:hypothetical protein